MATSSKFHYRKQVFARRRNIARVVSKGFNIKKNGELREFWSCTFQITNNTGADQTVWMRRLVCPFLAIRQQSQGFLRRCPYDVEAQASWPPPGYALIVKYFHACSYCGRPWPAAYINIIQNTHQIQVLTEALCRA